MASRGLTFYVSCPNWEHIYVASPLKHCTAVERCKWRTHTSSSIGWTWPIIKTNSHCEANMCQRANMLLLACFPCFCTKRNPTLAPSYISWDNYLLCASSRWNINISNHSYQKPSSPLSLSQWRIFEGGLDENLHAGVNLFFLATNKIFSKLCWVCISRWPSPFIFLLFRDSSGRAMPCPCEKHKEEMKRKKQERFWENNLGSAESGATGKVKISKWERTLFPLLICKSTWGWIHSSWCVKYNILIYFVINCENGGLHFDALLFQWMPKQTEFAKQQQWENYILAKWECKTTLASSNC